MFREQTGLTLHGYRTELRIRASLALISAGGLDLAEVALAVGFSGHSHFSTAFRRRVGVPPSSLRGRGDYPELADQMSVLPNVAGQSASGQGAGNASVPAASDAAR